MDISVRSNGIRYHIFDTRPDTEFKATGTEPLNTSEMLRLRCKGGQGVQGPVWWLLFDDQDDDEDGQDIQSAGTTKLYTVRAVQVDSIKTCVES
jgi:hypothetical protein